MLQRIQTVFLFLVAVLMLTMLFFPIWKHIGADGSFVRFMPMYLESGMGDAEGTKDYWPYAMVAGLAFISATIAFISISKYTNRLLQIKLGALNSLLIGVNLMLSAWLMTSLIDDMEVPGTYGVALFLPAAAIIFNSLASRYIRKDDKLVRSVDRIR